MKKKRMIFSGTVAEFDSIAKGRGFILKEEIKEYLPYAITYGIIKDVSEKEMEKVYELLMGYLKDTKGEQDGKNS